MILNELSISDVLNIALSNKLSNKLTTLILIIMFTITPDHYYHIRLSNKEEAIRLADLIKGIVYIFLEGEPLLVYSWRDSI